MECKRIKQGNTGPMWRVGVQEYDANGEPITGQYVDISDPNYTCELSVPTAVPPIARAVTDISSDNTRFLGQLSPIETATLPVGTHTVAIAVKNSTLSPPFDIEAHVDLIVDEGIIN